MNKMLMLVLMALMAVQVAMASQPVQMSNDAVAELEQHMTTEGLKDKLVGKVVDKVIDHADKKIGGHGGDVVKLTGNPCADEILPLCGVELSAATPSLRLKEVKKCMEEANKDELLSHACDKYMTPTKMRRVIELAKKSWAMYHKVIGFKSTVIKQIKKEVLDRMLRTVGLDDEYDALMKIVADGKKEVKDKIKGHVHVIRAKIRNIHGRKVDDAQVIGGRVVDEEGNVIDGAHEEDGKIVTDDGTVINGAKKVGDVIIDAAGNVIDGAAAFGYVIVDGYGKLIKGAKIWHGKIVDKNGKVIQKIKVVGGKIFGGIARFGKKVWAHMTKGTRACNADKKRLCKEFKGSRRKMRQCFETHWELGDLSTLCEDMLNARKRREERERNH